MKNIYLLGVCIACLCLFIPTTLLGQGSMFMVMQGVEGEGGTTIPTATAHYLFENDVTDETTDHDLTAEAGLTYDSSNYVEGSYAMIGDSNDFASVADHADFEPGTGDWSFSCWFRQTYAAWDGALVSKTYWGTGGWNGLHIFTDNDDADNVHASVWFEGTEYAADTSFTPTLDSFYHIVVTYDASETNEVTIWISSSGGTFGDQVDGTAYSVDETPVDYSGSFYVGHESIGGDEFIGQIDDLRWWKGTVVSESEAEALYDLY